MDSIGLGGFLNSVFFWFFFSVAIIFFLAFYRSNKYTSILIPSILLNIAFLNDQVLSIEAQVILLIVWPLLNVFGVLYGIVLLYRKKK
jgi:hypothetical protein